MSLKDAAERVKKRKNVMLGDMKGTAQNMAESLPHPLQERPTLFLREPLIKQFRRRLRNEKP